MIWHFFEVWLSLIAAFLIGCTIGALIYDLLARTSLATGQGAIADSIGGVVDRIKDRLGVGPVWRPQYRRAAAAREAEAVNGADRDAVDHAFPPAEGDLAPGWADERRDHDGVHVEERHVGQADEAAALREGAGAEAPVRRPVESDRQTQEPPADSGGAAEPAASAGASDEPAATPDEVVPMRPAILVEPRNGVPDNLQRIRGIGERNELRLNKLGIFHFGQIAAWTPAEMRWVGEHLAFPERIERDDWIGQAIILASGGDTGFTKSAERRRIRRQRQQLFASEHGEDDEEDDEEDDDA